MKYYHKLILLIGFAASSCSYPRINRERVVDVQDVVRVVECELYFASTNNPREANKLQIGRWDVASTLDLTLVSKIDADGKISWAIPINYTVTPNVGVSAQDTITAHVAFATNLKALKAKAPPEHCVLDDHLDPSGTGLGLAAWIETTLEAVGKDNHGGLSYTKTFEFRADASARLGFVLAPVNLDVGPGWHGTKTNQLVVAVAPPSGPQKVIVVSDTGRLTGRASPTDSRMRTFNNPNLNSKLLRQSPILLSPGQTLQLR